MTTFTANTDTPIGQAVAQREAGDIHGAIATLIAAAADSLADAPLAVTLAQMLAETDQVQRAERWFHHALKLAPDDLHVRMGYGTFLGQTGRVAEAREVLGPVREEVRDLLASAGPKQKRKLEGIQGFIACTEINLARAAFESGDSAAARALVSPWLADAEYWSGAHNVLAEVLERDGLDPTLLAEEGLASGQVSPYMVCHLLEVAVDTEPCDLPALDRLIARADACFAFDWKCAEPELDAVFARARQLFAHAVMRGVVEPATCPHLAALVDPTRAARARRIHFKRPQSR